MVDDLLDSDIGLWEKYTLATRVSDGFTAELKQDAYPLGFDGPPIKGKVVGDNPRQIVVTWHNYVRSRINEWENRKEAEASQRAQASASSSQPSTPAPGRLDGGEGPAAQNLPPREETLEEYLVAKVSSLSRSVSLIEAEIARTVESLGELRRRKREAVIERRRAERAAAVASGKPLRSRNNASQVRAQTSPKSPGQKKSRRARGRCGLVEGGIPEGTS